MPRDPRPVDSESEVAGLLRAALDGLDAHVLLLDADGLIVYANAAAARELARLEPGGSHRVGGLLYTDLCDWVCGQGIPEARGIARGIGEVLEGTRESLERDVGLFAGGREHVFQLRMRHLEGGAGACAFVSVSDVSEARRAERSLHAAREQAFSSSRAKSEFLANMSHEIRTPMNAIIGMTDILIQEAELGHPHAQYLKTVHSSAQGLLTLLNDVLDFSKVEARKLELEHIPFSLRGSLSDAMKVLAFRAHEKGLEYACSVDPRVPDTLIGDPGRLRQVLVNLLSNAIKFTRRGEVVLRVSEAEQGDFGGALHFEVADTGVGIPQEKQVLVFGAFAQGDGSTSREYGGTGLGLAISAELVRLMGGRIWVESEQGKGSRFHFTADFPIDDDVRPPALPGADELDGMPVLVVDDNATSRTILADDLRTWKMRPVCVDSSAAALEAVETAHAVGRAFEIVLLDAQMPRIDGFQLAERLRADPRNSATRVVIMTAAGQPGDGAQCRTLSLNGYLIKPISSLDLLAALQLVVAQPTTSGGARELVTRHSVRERDQRLDVLIAEDDDSSRTLAVHLLKKRGHRVTAVTDGRKAFEAWSERRFDVILMDVQMPRWDGYEATRRIREAEHGSGGRVPIVALTASAMSGDRERCLQVGMDGYVAKPVRPEELFREIEKLTDPGDPQATSA